MATKMLATWALALQFDNLTAPIHDMAVKSVYNWAGCAIGGYNQATPAKALDAISPFVGQGNSSILGTGEVVDVQTAALINGIASHADDYDDTLRDNPTHPAGPVLSALLAVAEWAAPVSGEDFLTAFVAGVEAESKLGISVFPEHYDIGWHITSTVGSVGAAVAVGKVLGLNETEMQHAIGISAVQVNGMHESFGTDAKPFHVGRSAQAGLLGALLARKEFTASTEALEAERGWANVVSTRQNVTEEIGTLGETWEILQNTFKPFPCDRIIHAAIDGWIQAHDEAAEKGLDMSTATNVTARCHPRVLFLADDKKPTTGLAGKFSVYHAAAVALLDGEATPKQFTDEAVQNSTVIELREKVSVTSDDAVEEHEAFVSVEFDNGEKIEIHVEDALGSFENPLSSEQLEEKYIDQVAAVIGDERAQKASQVWLGIANATDVAGLVQGYAA